MYCTTDLSDVTSVLLTDGKWYRVKRGTLRSVNFLDWPDSFVPGFEFTESPSRSTTVRQDSIVALRYSEGSRTVGFK